MILFSFYMLFSTPRFSTRIITKLGSSVVGGVGCKA